MITLTDPVPVRTVLGSNATIGYDKLVPGTMQLNPVTGQVDIPFTLTSTASPNNSPIHGVLRITENGTLTFEMNKVGIERRVVLTAPQIASVRSIITTAQNSFETGLINLGVIAGTQSPGV